jgi:hypothetical protein
LEKKKARSLEIPGFSREIKECKDCILGCVQCPPRVFQGTSRASRFSCYFFRHQRVVFSRVMPFPAPTPRVSRTFGSTPDDIRFHFRDSNTYDGVNVLKNNNKQTA